MKNNIIKIVSLFAVVLSIFTTSCSKDDELKPLEFSVSEAEFSFPSEGGSSNFSVTSSSEWTVESNIDWCLVSPANGLGSMECELRIDTSYLYKEREGILTFHSFNKSIQIKVNQFGFEKTIAADEKKFSLPDYMPKGENILEVDVRSNIEIQVEVPAECDWLTYTIEKQDISSIPGPRTIKFEYKTNMFSQERNVDVVIKHVHDKDNSAEPITLSLTQKPAPTIVPSREGDSLSIVMMARMLNTYDPSATGLPMVNWSSVKLKEFPKENGNPGEYELRVVDATFNILDIDETIPYQVQFLTKLEALTVNGNTNGHIKSIDLGPEVCKLENLKYLQISGYGLTTLPEEMKQMKALEALSLTGNYFEELPVEIIAAIPTLKHINFSGCIRYEVLDLTQVGPEDKLGLRGFIPEEIFMEKLETIILGFNNFEGQIPDLPVGSMSNLKKLSINLNFLTGEAPQWILEHPTLGCWDAGQLLFPQRRGKDSDGNIAGLTNEPVRYPDCTLW